MPSFEIRVDTNGLEDKLMKKSSEIALKVGIFKHDLLIMGRREVQRVTPRRHTGKAKSSIKYKISGDTGQIYASKEVAPYIDWVIEGRGIVRPVNAKALHFFIYGKEVFAMKVKPTKPNPIFDNAMPGIAANMEHEVQALTKWLGEL